MVAQLLTSVRGASDPGPFTSLFALIPQKVQQGEVWRLLTHAFLHDTTSIWHILGNMLLLWWFGRQVEDRLGPREFLAVYLVSALFAGLAFQGAAMAGFHRFHTLALGASGAVTAVLLLSALYYPSQIIYLFFVLPIPIWFFVVYLLARDLFGFLGKSESGIATSAHLAGALFGFAYYQFDWRLTSLFSGWGGAVTRAKARARLRIYSPDEEAQAPSSRIRDEQLEAQMDAILEKVSRVGMGGLTEAEKQTLLRASETIRKKQH
jgi:membrane associated rhomboid family serine protease